MIETFQLFHPDQNGPDPVAAQNRVIFDCDNSRNPLKLDHHVDFFAHIADKVLQCRRPRPGHAERTIGRPVNIFRPKIRSVRSVVGACLIRPHLQDLEGALIITAQIVPHDLIDSTICSLSQTLSHLPLRPDRSKEFLNIL